ncbi:hypothetical protein ILUMI_17072, partial [Ignelater luminosus]
QKWYKGFTARHSEISARLTQNLTKCRSYLTEGKIRNWFQEINDYLTANHLEAVVKDSQRIYNADKTAFFLAPRRMKCLIRKGDKTAYSFIGNDEKECLTCLMIANASGDLPPPLIIYNYERLPAHIINMMPKKWAIGKSESGWMTFEYVANIFNPWLSENEIPRLVLFFVDGHASHLSMDLSNFCTEYQIILFALYSNATYVLQPMDVTVFHPLKNAWKTGVHNYKLENDDQKLKREYLLHFLKRYFKDDKNKSDVVNAKPNLEFKIKNEFLEYLEAKLGNEKLSNFKLEEEADDWSGVVKDTNLFMLWKNIRNKLKMLKEQTNLEVSKLQEKNGSLPDS